MFALVSALHYEIQEKVEEYLPGETELNEEKWAARKNSVNVTDLRWFRKEKLRFLRAKYLESFFSGVFGQEVVNHFVYLEYGIGKAMKLKKKHFLRRVKIQILASHQ
jgi:hypothetical protein